MDQPGERKRRQCRLTIHPTRPVEARQPEDRGQQPGTGFLQTAGFRDLQDGHRLRNLRCLERAADAEPGYPVRLRPGQQAVPEFYLAPVGLQESRDRVEQGRLAGAICTDDRGDLASRGDQLHAGQRLKAGEALLNPGYGQGLTGNRQALGGNARTRVALTSGWAGDPTRDSPAGHADQTHHATGEQDADGQQENTVNRYRVLLERTGLQRPENQERRAQRSAPDAVGPADDRRREHGDQHVHREGVRADESRQVGEQGSGDTRREGPQYIGGNLQAKRGTAQRLRQSRALAEHSQRGSERGHDHIAEDKHPYGRDDHRDGVEAGITERLAEQGGTDDAGQAEQASGLGLQDLRDTRDKKDEEERHDRERPVTQAHARYARQQTSQRGQDDRGQDRQRQVSNSVVIQYCGHICARREHSYLTQGHFIGVSEAEVQAAAQEGVNPDEHDLPLPVGADAEQWQHGHDDRSRNRYPRAGRNRTPNTRVHPRPPSGRAARTNRPASRAAGGSK